MKSTIRTYYNATDGIADKTDSPYISEMVKITKRPWRYLEKVANADRSAAAADKRHGRKHKKPAIGLTGRNDTQKAATLGNLAEVDYQGFTNELYFTKWVSGTVPTTRPWLVDSNLDRYLGRALLADGLATTLAGSGGGAATTTYAENIGVMAASRVYSALAHWVAAVFAVLLGLCPKFGALAASVPSGVLGGAGVVLYGMIGVLGARIWVQNRVNFSSPTNLMTAAVGLILGIGGFTLALGDFTLGAISVGSFAALGIYHGMRAIARMRGTDPHLGTRAVDATGEDVSLAQ